MIDFEQLNERLGQNELVITKVFEAFLELYRSDQPLFSSLAEQKDFEGLRQFSHGLKGALLNICADEEAAIAASIETFSRDQTEADPQLYDLMELRVQRIIEQIETHLNTKS